MKPQLRCNECVIIRSVSMSFVIPASCPTVLEQMLIFITVGCLSFYEKESENMCVFFFCLASLSIVTLKVIRVVEGISVSFSFSAEGNGVYGYSTILCLPLMNLWDVSTFWLLPITWLWTVVYKPLHAIYISFSLGSSHRRGMAGSYGRGVLKYLTFLRNCQTISLSGCVPSRSCQQNRSAHLLHTLDST